MAFPHEQYNQEIHQEFPARLISFNSCMNGQEISNGLASLQVNVSSIAILSEILQLQQASDSIIKHTRPAQVSRGGGDKSEL